MTIDTQHTKCVRIYIRVCVCVCDSTKILMIYEKDVELVFDDEAKKTNHSEE